MSKAFTKETDDDSDDDGMPEGEGDLAKLPGRRNYMTPACALKMRAELKQILMVDRPALTQVVSWAASNGDRSENADYTYGKRKLREMDRRIRFLQKRLEAAEIVDPARQKSDRVLFGATVSILNEEGEAKVYRIVGIDETDVRKGHVSWISPMGTALLNHREGTPSPSKLPREIRSWRSFRFVMRGSRDKAVPMSTPKGVILLNLGTPDGEHPGPTVSQVRSYLREFLMDPLVVDIPALARFILVHAMILPKRPKRSREAYHKVWTKRGSPLLVHLEDLVFKVSQKVGPGFCVVGGMRYGNPSIKQALLALKEAGVKETRVIPLYPQYSLAATESSIIACQQLAREHAPEMKLTFQPPFYGEAGFLDAYADVAKRTLDHIPHDHVIFSFHGLPERQIRKVDPSGKTCLASERCCDRITSANQNCYRAQCFQTARELADRLKIPKDRYSVAFQSRLGVTAWIKPYTDLLYGELVKRGHKRVAVLCPAFVADCLETLEEVAIRGNDQFRRLGGEILHLVPSLNSEAEWVDSVASWVVRS